MKIPIFLLLLLGITFGEKKSQNLCAIDTLRTYILDKITELWDETGHAEWQYLAQKNNGLDGELITEFKALCDQLDNFTAPIVPVNILNSIWSWPIMEEEINNINRLYSTFRKLQARPDPLIFAKSWEDLAHDIISDNKRHTALKSFEIIHDMVFVNGDTEKSIFDSVRQVMFKFIFKLQIIYFSNIMI